MTALPRLPDIAFRMHFANGRWLPIDVWALSQEVFWREGTSQILSAAGRSVHRKAWWSLLMLKSNDPVGRLDLMLSHRIDFKARSLVRNLSVLGWWQVAIAARPDVVSTLLTALPNDFGDLLFSQRTTIRKRNHTQTRYCIVNHFLLYALSNEMSTANWSILLDRWPHQEVCSIPLGLHNLLFDRAHGVNAWGHTRDMVQFKKVPTRSLSAWAALDAALAPRILQHPEWQSEVNAMDCDAQLPKTLAALRMPSIRDGLLRHASSPSP